MKWIFYVIVFVYLCFRAVYGARSVLSTITIEEINYGKRNFWPAGTHQSINCKAPPKNKKDVEWVDPSGVIVGRVPTNRVFAQDHFAQIPKGGRAPALVLNFKNIQPKDAGIYKCRSGGLNNYVNVCVIDPLVFVDTPAEVTADLGRAITLTCQATGNPEPRIVWMRNGENIDDENEDSKYKVMTKYNSQGFEGLLTVTSLEPEDSGLYYCVALQENSRTEDCAYSEAANITLHVNHAPIFEDGNDTKIYGKNNESVDLICSASAYPSPKFRWFRDADVNTLKEFDKEKIVFNEEENQAILTVTGGPATFGLRYKCQASNSFGVADKYFTLLKMEEPKEPSDVNFHKSTDNEIELSISWSEDVNFPIDTFEIQHVKKDQLKNPDSVPKEDDWKKSTRLHLEREDATETNEEDSETNGLLISIPNLDAESNYWIRLRVVNDAGESSWSDPIIASTLSKSDEATEESGVAEKTEEPVEEEKIVKAELSSDGTFYGIFFACGIIIIAVVCMFAMRIV